MVLKIIGLEMVFDVTHQ